MSERLVSRSPKIARLLLAGVALVGGGTALGAGYEARLNAVDAQNVVSIRGCLTHTKVPGIVDKATIYCLDGIGNDVLEGVRDYTPNHRVITTGDSTSPVISFGNHLMENSQDFNRNAPIVGALVGLVVFLSVNDTLNRM